MSLDEGVRPDMGHENAHRPTKGDNLSCVVSTQACDVSGVVGLSHVDVRQQRNASSIGSALHSGKAQATEQRDPQA